MTFQQFVDAARSAWGAVNNVTIVAALLVSCGINLVFPSVPGPAAVLACLLCYLAGFLVSCYKVAERAPEIAAKDARIVELEKRPTLKAVDDLKRAHAEELAARDAECERRLADALKPYTDKFDLSRFDDKELTVMLRTFEGEDGPQGGGRWTDDNMVAMGLVERGVLVKTNARPITREGYDGWYLFRLDPDWRAFIRRSESAMKERLGESYGKEEL